MNRFRSDRRRNLLGSLLVIGLGFAGTWGCDSQASVESPPAAPIPPSWQPVDQTSGATALPDPATFQFKDEVESNREDDGAIGSLEFVDTEGARVRLDDFTDKNNVLLVFTRGFAGELCPFCTTQTSRLIANYDEFRKRETEVLLVYPGQKTQLGDFLAASLEPSSADAFPFPVLLDEDLAAVKRLGIAAQLAFPSTFIIDKQGSVKLSYVGKGPTDRPSVKALLTQLDSLQP